MGLEQFSLADKVTIVTGGRQGIGQVVANQLAAAGADIVIFDMQDASEVAADIAKRNGVRTTAVVVDVTDPEAVEAAVNIAAERMGTLDLLFNNAGIVINESALDTPPADFSKVVDINLNGIFYVAQAFAKFLVANEKTGNIVNTASMSGSVVNVPQGQASYNASKAGVMHLTKSLAVEWAPLGIRVNSISPGYIATEMTASARDDWQKIWMSMLPFRRMGTPEELGGAVIYLLSDASSYTSGSDLIIDGCYTSV